MVSKEEGTGVRPGLEEEPEDSAATGQSTNAGQQEAGKKSVSDPAEPVQQVPTSEYTCWTQVPLFLFTYIPKVSLSSLTCDTES